MNTQEFSIRRAERKQAKLRLGISGPSGSGKTYSALLLAFGLGGKVGMIDTENGSGDLYAHIGEYDIITLSPPYDPKRYIAAIKAFEQAGHDVIIVDSLSHAWAGEGGILDKQGRMADSGKFNSYTAWRTVTPEHNALVDALLRSRSHIVATLRSKTEYIIEKDLKGRDVPRKIGLAPIQRDGMEYEFSVFMEISQDHFASATKDRTGLFDGQFFKIAPEVGVRLQSWLNDGSPLETVAVITMDDWIQLQAEARQQGVAPKRLLEWLQENYGINKASDLLAERLSEVKGRLSQIKDAVSTNPV